MLQENHCIEFKSTLNDKFEIEIIAFLNSRDGGSLYLGIEDTGRVIGVDKVDETQLMIASRLRDRIVPSVMGLFDICVENLDGKQVVCVRVASGPQKPYYIRDKGMSPAGCFIRIGSASVPMEASMIEMLYSKRAILGLASIPAPRQSLTFRQLKIYYENRKHPLNDRFETTLELKNDDEKYNYLAYLLADENGNSLRIARYQGTDKCVLVDNADYGYCSIIQSVYRILDRMLVENRTFCKITNTTRIEKSMIDPVALREIVINAIVHNDYTKGYTPAFEFFKDRLEITSFGGLQAGQTEADMFSGASMPRNRELMRIFRDLELVEQLGSGMSRIIKAYGRDIYQIHDNYIRVVLPYDLSGLDEIDAIYHNNEGTHSDRNFPKSELKDYNNVPDVPDNVTKSGLKDNDNVPDVPDNVTKSGLKDNDNVHDIELLKLDLQVLELLRNNASMPSSELAVLLKVSTKTIKRAFAKLKSLKYIERIGDTKSGHWNVLK